MIKVSVIMPIYNAQKFLRESLDSILSQSLNKIEIICVDDGSEDGTSDILNEYALKNDCIKIIHQQNQGAGVARNRGMLEATGEYLAFLDCDDVYEKDMLQLMYNEAYASDLDVIVCRSDRFVKDADKRIRCDWTIHNKLLPQKEVFSANDVNKDFFMTFVWWPWDKLFKREFILNNDLEYQNLRTTNDLYFVSCAALAAKRISWIDKVLVHHRTGGTSSLSVTREKSWGNFYEALVAVKQFMVDNKLFVRFEQDFLNYCAHFCLWQLKTIWGQSYALLYNKLKNQWLNELGLVTANKAKIYNEVDYRMIRYILDRDISCFGPINSNKVYQIFIKMRMYIAGYGIKQTLKKILEKLPEYI